MYIYKDLIYRIRGLSSDSLCEGWGRFRRIAFVQQSLQHNVCEIINAGGRRYRARLIISCWILSPLSHIHYSAESHPDWHQLLAEIHQSHLKRG